MCTQIFETRIILTCRVTLLLGGGNISSKYTPLYKSFILMMRPIRTELKSSSLYMTWLRARAEGATFKSKSGLLSALAPWAKSNFCPGIRKGDLVKTQRETHGHHHLARKQISTAIHLRREEDKDCKSRSLISSVANESDLSLSSETLRRRHRGHNLPGPSLGLPSVAE